MNGRIPRVAFVALVLALVGRPVSARDSASPKLPVVVVQSLQWFPPDTETLIVANGPFRVVRESEETTAAERLRSIPSGILPALRGGLVADDLRELNLVVAVDGRRRFRLPKDIGSGPYEGCQMLRFDDASDRALEKVFQTCMKRADRTERIAGNDVAIFTKKAFRDVSWLFVTHPRNGVLMCATNRSYLDEVLRRMEQKVETRAFPEDLPEWRQVDVSAAIWGVRHYRKDNADTDPTSPLSSKAPPTVRDAKPIGIVFWNDLKPDSQTKFRHLFGGSNVLTAVQTQWSQGVLERLHAKVGEVADGVVEVLIPAPAKEEIDEQYFFFIYMLCFFIGQATTV